MTDPSSIPENNGDMAGDFGEAATTPSPPAHRAIFTRTSVGVLLALCIAAGYIAMGRQKAVRQAEAMDAIVQAGGHVYLDYQWQRGQPAPDAPPPQAAWVRALVGDIMLNRAVAVDLRGVQRPDDVAPTLLLLPYLLHIQAEDTALSDASLATWRQKSGLRGLELQGTQVTDAGVESLAGLSQLIWLSLARTAVSDKSVPVLARLRRLQRLDLSGTHITLDAADSLRAQLPKCQISLQTSLRDE
jgi:hypothetical protein